MIKGVENFDKYYRITGYISSCVHGQGRSTADRQFVYFNKRPVDYAKVSSLL